MTDNQFLKSLGKGKQLGDNYFSATTKQQIILSIAGGRWERRCITETVDPILRLLVRDFARLDSCSDGCRLSRSLILFSTLFLVFYQIYHFSGRLMGEDEFSPVGCLRFIILVIFGPSKFGFSVIV